MHSLYENNHTKIKVARSPYRCHIMSEIKSKGELKMEIISTNINNDEWNMDISYDMFESPDRKAIKDNSGKTVTINKYAIYEEYNNDESVVRLLTMLTSENEVYVTTSPAFIRTFERIAELAYRSHLDTFTITFRKEKSKNNREYMTAVYAKES